MRRSQPSIATDFDWQQLRQLAGEDADFEAELLAMFLTDASSSLLQLEQAIAEHDIPATEELAHALRGASANVGASGLANAAAQLEHMARTGHVTGAIALLQDIRGYCQQIQAYLK